MRKGSHVVFSICLHVVFVTKYRRKVLTDAMLADMKEVFQTILEANNTFRNNQEEGCQNKGFDAPYFDSLSIPTS
jgi:putative transposase